MMMTTIKEELMDEPMDLMEQAEVAPQDPQEMTVEEKDPFAKLRNKYKKKKSQIEELTAVKEYLETTLAEKDQKIAELRAKKRLQKQEITQKDEELERIRAELEAFKRSRTGRRIIKKATAPRKPRASAPAASKENKSPAAIEAARQQAPLIRMYNNLKVACTQKPEILEGTRPRKVVDYGPPNRKK